MTKKILHILLLLLNTLMVLGQPLITDLGFGYQGSALYDFGGKSEEVLATAVNNEGQILVVARPISPYNSQNMFVTKFSSAGVLDTGFGIAGKVSISTQGNGYNLYGFLVLEDQFLLLLKKDINILEIWSFDYTGHFNSNFGTGGIVSFPIIGYSEKIRLFQGFDDTLIAQFYDVSGSSILLKLMSFNSEDGSINYSFGNQGLLAYSVTQDYYFSKLVIVDSNYYFVGNDNSSSQNELVVFKTNSQGEIASNYGNDGLVSIPHAGNITVRNVMTVESDKLLILAEAQKYEASFAPYDIKGFRLLPDGSLDPNYSVNGFFELDLTVSNLHLLAAELLNNETLKLYVAEDYYQGSQLNKMFSCQLDSTGQIIEGTLNVFCIECMSVFPRMIIMEDQFVFISQHQNDIMINNMILEDGVESFFDEFTTNIYNLSDSYHNFNNVIVTSNDLILAKDYENDDLDALIIKGIDSHSMIAFSHFLSNGITDVADYFGSLGQDIFNCGDHICLGQTTYINESFVYIIKRYNPLNLANSDWYNFPLSTDQFSNPYHTLNLIHYKSSDNGILICKQSINQQETNVILRDIISHETLSEYITSLLIPNMDTDNGVNPICAYDDLSYLLTGYINLAVDSAQFTVEKRLVNSQLDLNFGTNGRYAVTNYIRSKAYSSALDSEGNIFACGMVEDSDSIGSIAYLTKLSINGELDVNFGQQGAYTYDSLGIDYIAKDVLAVSDDIVLLGCVEYNAGVINSKIICLDAHTGLPITNFGQAGIMEFGPNKEFIRFNRFSNGDLLIVFRTKTLYDHQLELVKMKVNPISGVPEIFRPIAWYYNDGELLLNLPDEFLSSTIDIKISDMQGRVIRQQLVTTKDFYNGNYNLILDISNLPNSMYVLTAFSSNKINSTLFVKR